MVAQLLWGGMGSLNVQTEIQGTPDSVNTRKLYLLRYVVGRFHNISLRPVSQAVLHGKHIYIWISIKKKQEEIQQKRFDALSGTIHQ